MRAVVAPWVLLKTSDSVSATGLRLQFRALEKCKVHAECNRRTVSVALGENPALRHDTTETMSLSSTASKNREVEQLADDSASTSEEVPAPALTSTDCRVCYEEYL